MLQEEEAIEESDEELLKALDSRYYARETDPIELLFSQLPADFDERWLNKEIKRRERQRELVEASLADRVIKSYNAFGNSRSFLAAFSSYLQFAEAEHIL